MTAPKPNLISSVLQDFSSTILVENTPDQNTIVNGFDAVNANADKNVL